MGSQIAGRQRPQRISRMTRIALSSATLLAVCLPASAQTQASSAASETVVATPQRIRRVVVSIPDRKLALLEDGRVVKIYRVAVGAPGSPSPSGEFKIVQRLKDPTYYHPGVVVPPGPGNPLGTRWMGLSAKGFGIHGTNQPGSVGRNASHGCIRLRNRDAEDLFERVRPGDSVALIAERNEEVAQVFDDVLPAKTLGQQITLIAQNSELATETLVAGRKK
jgi:lipoprotein-anchoring transpeptidase ErfK/SrfK